MLGGYQYSSQCYNYYFVTLLTIDIRSISNEIYAATGGDVLKLVRIKSPRKKTIFFVRRIMVQ